MSCFVHGWIPQDRPCPVCVLPTRLDLFAAAALTGLLAREPADTEMLFSDRRRITNLAAILAQFQIVAVDNLRTATEKEVQP